jgi:hypothetical protein
MILFQEISVKTNCYDPEQLETGMKLYDALYSWAKFAKEEIHTWNNKA